jgi:hypothetical protein
MADLATFPRERLSRFVVSVDLLAGKLTEGFQLVDTA